MPKIFYQVRIDKKLRSQFIEVVPWGYQGRVVEALIEALLNAAVEDGIDLCIAKLIDDRYMLVEKEEE